MTTCPKCGAKAWKTVDDKDKKFCYYECGSNGWISHNPDLASRSDACRIAELEAENAKLKSDNANLRNDLRLLREGLFEVLARASEAENAKLREDLAIIISDFDSNPERSLKEKLILLVDELNALRRATNSKGNLISELEAENAKLREDKERLLEAANAFIMYCDGHSSIVMPERVTRAALAMSKDPCEHVLSERA